MPKYALYLQERRRKVIQDLTVDVQRAIDFLEDVENSLVKYLDMEFRNAEDLRSYYREKFDNRIVSRGEVSEDTNSELSETDTDRTE